MEFLTKLDFNRLVYESMGYFLYPYATPASQRVPYATYTTQRGFNGFYAVETFMPNCRYNPT